ncbi:MAG: TolC family protein [Magnetococcales bacterium]|nr:TolC family protein [Magnetococcales bacterium]
MHSTRTESSRISGEDSPVRELRTGLLIRTMACALVTGVVATLAPLQLHAQPPLRSLAEQSGGQDHSSTPGTADGNTLQPATADASTASGHQFDDQQVLDALSQALDSDTQGARRILAGRTLRLLSPSQLHDLVLSRNITLQQGRTDLEISKEQLTAADAAFDAALSVSSSWNAYRTRKRSVEISRLRDPDVFDEIQEGDYVAGELIQAGDPRIGQPYIEAAISTCVIIDGETAGTSCNLSAPTNTTEEEYASSESHEWYQNWSWTTALSDTFLWGQSWSAQVQTSFYPYETSKSASVGLNTAINLGKREWASSASASLSTPLPWTKGFGPLGSAASLSLHLAELNRDKARFTLIETLNSQLRSALATYWDLVRQTLKISTALQHHTVLKQQRDRVQRLMDAGRATEYDLLQAENALFTARNQEEIAWNSLIARSNELAELLNLPADTIPMPANYQSTIETPRIPDSHQALDAAFSNRALLNSLQLDLKGQEATIEHRENQMAPDLSFKASYSVSQSTSVWAYDTYSDSLKNISDPDTASWSLGLTLSFPLGNTAVRSQYTQALATRDQVRDAYRESEIQVTQNVNTALATLNSVTSRIEMARINQNMAEETWKQAKRLHGIGRLSLFEVISREQERFAARNAYIDALIDGHQAQVELSAAQGLLGKQAAGSLHLNSEGDAS